jgi:exopolysaccharide production protein ExoQ
MGVLIWVLFPMAASVLLPLTAIAPLGWTRFEWRRLPTQPVAPATTALALAAMYLMINASWSLSPRSAAMAVVLVVVMVATLHVVVSTLPEVDPPPLEAMAIGALAGLAVAGGVLCVEVLSDQLLRRLLIGLVPALQPSPHHVSMQGGQLTGLAPYLTNASVAVVTLMFWPAALTASRLGLLRARKTLVGIAAVMAAATVFASEHATSQLAFVGAGLVFILARMRLQLARPVVMAGWVGATLLVVPVVLLLYSAEAYRAPWLAQSARHRVVIWHATAGQIHNAPILGTGIGSARALRQVAVRERVTAPGTTFRLSPSLHSHNAYLQVWYEAGGVGALLLLALGLVALRTLAKFADDKQPFLLASFAAGAVLIASAYSIWAPWFMASLAMAAIFALVGAAVPARQTP